MNGLSLFSGIGGLDLGLERAGITTVGQVEIDPWCRRVLAKHWPDVPRHDDVRTAAHWWLSEERPHVDVVFGGFPCQPFSTAGHRRGVGDERWGWPWFESIVRVLRPRYVLVENVANLVRGRRFRAAVGWLLGDLATLGYDVEWDCIPAEAIGARHERDRWFAVAYPSGEFGWLQPVGIAGSSSQTIAGDDGPARPVAHPDGERLEGRWLPERPRDGTSDADWSGPRIFRWRPEDCDEWAVEPGVGRVAHGVPGRVDRLRGLGNAVVPQVAEHVGRLIVAADRERGAA